MGHLAETVDREREQGNNLLISSSIFHMSLLVKLPWITRKLQKKQLTKALYPVFLFRQLSNQELKFMATFATLERVVPAAESKSPAQVQKPSTPTSSTQQNKFTAEDLFNYLYGYTPIRLVDPIQLLRRQVENGATNKHTMSCK